MRLLYVHSVPVPSQAANSVQVAKMCQAFRVPLRGKMKLTYVHTAPVPSPAANAVQVARTCAAYTAAGAETRLVQPSGGRGDAGYIPSEYDLEADLVVNNPPMLSVSVV